MSEEFNQKRELRRLLIETSKGNIYALWLLRELDEDNDLAYPDIIIEGIKSNDEMLRFISDKFYDKYERRILSLLLEKPYRLVAVPSIILAKKPNIVRTILAKEGDLYQYLDKSLRENERFTEIAVYSKPLMLQFTTLEWKKSHISKIVMVVSNEPRAASAISLDLLEELEKEGRTNDKTLLIDTVKNAIIRDSVAAARIDSNLVDVFKDEMLYALERNPMVYHILSREVKESYPNFAKVAVKSMPEIYHYVPFDIRKGDLILALDAISGDTFSASYIEKELYLESDELFSIALSRYQRCGELIDLDIAKKYDKEIKKAINSRPDIVKDISEEVLLKYPFYVKIAIRNKWELIRDLPKNVLIKNPQIAKIAYEASPSAIIYIPDELFDMDLEWLK